MIITDAQIIYLEFFSRLRLVIQLVVIVTTSLSALFICIAAITSAAGVGRTCSAVESIIAALLPAGSQFEYGAKQLHINCLYLCTV